jgi:hypothetical protein
MVISVLSPQKTHNYKFFADLLAVKHQDIPCLRYIVSDGFYTKKFKFRGLMTEEKIQGFVDKILQNKIKPYFIS